ncbi:MAG: DUF1330 domain-containing protein [Pleurocapsa sp. MO_192.B19]|nr:DUF1330 domain-containing protein [Pleurocapsa sp. MO_192.B19]
MIKTTGFLASLLLAIAVCIPQLKAEQSPQVIAQPTNESITFFELMWLNEDEGGLEAAQDYFQKITPIVECYGIEFNASYRPVEVTSGYLQAPDFIFGFTFPSQQVLERFNQDPEYAQLVPTRNRIFNFDDKIQFRVKPF